MGSGASAATPEEKVATLNKLVAEASPEELQKFAQESLTEEDRKKLQGSLLASAAPKAGGAATKHPTDESFLAEKSPRVLEDLTSEWLSHLLGAKVESFETKKLMAGQAGDAMMVYPTYQAAAEGGEAAAAPKSFVLKLAKTVDQGRAFATSNRLYEKEMRFYKELAPEVGKLVHVPKLIGAFADKEKPLEYFSLALEDLSETFDTVNMVTGITKPQALSLTRQIAKMHALYWGREAAPELEWVLRKDPEVEGGLLPGAWMVQAWLGDPGSAYKKWKDLAEKDLGFAAYSGDSVKIFEELFAGDKGKPLARAILAKLNSRPKTLVHGDLNANNLFRDKTAPAGGEAEDWPMRTVDWQTLGFFCPGVEFPVLWSFLSPIELFDELDTFCDAYLETLHANSDAAKQSYTKEMLKEEIALCCTLFYCNASFIFNMLFAGNPSHPLKPMAMGCCQRLDRLLAVTDALKVVTAVAEEAAPPVSAVSRYTKKKVAVNGKQMAYIDVGEGDPIVFLHGNPTSSYMWRNVMPHCEGLGRLIAPDLIGMGDSDKLEDAGPETYSLPQQAVFLDGFLEALGVKENVTLVFHSWGATLGTHWASRHADAMKGMVIMECVFAPFESWESLPDHLRGGFQTIKSEKGEAIVLDMNVMIEKTIPGSVMRKLSDAELEEYKRPFPDRESRRPILAFARAVPVAGEPADVAAMMTQTLAWLEKSSTPKLFVNGDPGSSMFPAERDLVRTWQSVTEVTVKGTHNLPEDSPNDIGKAIVDWYPKPKV